MATTLPASPTSARAVKKPRSRRFVSLDGRIGVEDWAKLPETKPHYELIDGVLKQKPMKTYRQSYAASRLALALCGQLENQGWQVFTSGTGFKADEWNGFVPDVMVFTAQTVLAPNAVYESAAFLVAEVASPLISKLHFAKKKRSYQCSGVELLLFIDPTKKTLEVFRLENEKYGAPETLQDAEIWRPAELPGLALEIAKLWM